MCAPVRARQVTGTSSRDLRPVEGSEFTEPADLVLIAIGFSHPEHEGLVDQLAVDLDGRGNVKAPVYETSEHGVFACGDARIGQSLVVTAIAEGRKCARIVDRQLTGEAGRAREEVIVGALADEELHHLLREEVETAGTVVPGETFFDPPR